MISAEQEIVEAYFESNGFLIRKVGMPDESDSKKKKYPFPTIAVLNPVIRKNSRSLGFRVFTGDLNKFRAALVSRLGWENTAFTHSMLDSDARLNRFYKQEAYKERVSIGYNPAPDLAEGRMGSYLRLLVIPAVPRSEIKMEELFHHFREIGVDGILTLSSMLENLLRQSLKTQNYAGNGIFQLLRLLKVYQLAREPQLDFFIN